MRICLFSSKPYDHQSFPAAHRPSHWHLQFHETRLTLDSAALADGCDGLRLHQ